MCDDEHKDNHHDDSDVDIHTLEVIFITCKAFITFVLNMNTCSRCSDPSAGSSSLFLALAL